MRLELTARNADITPDLRRLVDHKLARLERVLNDSAVSAQAVLTREKYRHRAEITLHTRGEKFLHGVGSTRSWETAVAMAIEKIEQQVHKVKGKWQERKRRGRQHAALAADLAQEAAPAASAPRAETPRVRARVPRTLRTVRQAIKLMSVSAAARELDSSGDGIVVFRDPQTEGINILYRRKDGELTLVETEV